MQLDMERPAYRRRCRDRGEHEAHYWVLEKDGQVVIQFYCPGRVSRRQE